MENFKRQLDIKKIRESYDLDYLKKVINNELIPSLNYHIKKREKENYLFIKNRKTTLQSDLNNYRHNRVIAEDEEESFIKLYFSMEFKNNVDFLLNNLKESIRMQNRKIYYHGSIFDIDKSKTINPSKSAVLNQEKVVFATNKRFIALVFIPRWGDDDIRFGKINGRWYVKENKYRAFESIFYNVSGYIYHVDSSNFHTDSRLSLKGSEFISKTPVPILKKEFIKNVWNELQKSSELTFIKYK
jgi:hypothetical protein